MRRVREKVRTQTGRGRAGTDIRATIARLNPILRGWGGYLRTGNAADKFIEIDRYVAWRLRRLMVSRHGRNLRARQAERWTRQWFEGRGLYRLSGTVRYPGSRNHVPKTVGEPCAGEPHARIERGTGKRVRPAATAPLTTNGRTGKSDVVRVAAGDAGPAR
jgi:Group II intron, maturase-specific domain